MQCPACGSENSDRATFCSLCFGPLAQPPSSEPVDLTPAAPDLATLRPAENATPLDTPGRPSGLERFASATSELEGGIASQKIDRKLGPSKGRLPLPGGLSISPLAAAMLLPGLLLLVGLVFWIASGGLAKANEGKVARLPVPAGSQLVAVDREITEGPLGELSEEKQESLATRVFSAPLSSQAATEYDLSGPGSTALAEEEWSEPAVLQDDEYGAMLQWTRTAALGPRASERQQLGIVIIPESTASCMVRITCMSAGLEKLEYPEK